MEKTPIRIIKQGPLKQSDWTNRNGEKVIISSVELTMTDGIDTFVGEVNDQQAINIDRSPLDQRCLYGVQCRMETKSSTNKDTGEVRHFTRIRVVKITDINCVTVD